MSRIIGKGLRRRFSIWADEDDVLICDPGRDYFHTVDTLDSRLLKQVAFVFSNAFYYSICYSIV